MKAVKKWTEEKVFPAKQVIPINYCRRNDGIRKSPYGNSYSTEHDC